MNARYWHNEDIRVPLKSNSLAPRDTTPAGLATAENKCALILAAVLFQISQYALIGQIKAERSSPKGSVARAIQPNTSGIDFHLDWGVSQFLSKQVQVGLVGYVYEQLTPDSGCAPILCPFESRVIGIGPQFGYIFPMAGMQGYVNLKGYGEFDHDNRPDGWNVWLTFVLSPTPPSSTPSPPPIATKTPRG